MSDGLSSWCKECRKEYQRNYNNTHKEKRHLQYKEYHNKDKQRYNQNSKNWRKNNPEYKQEYQKEYQQNNPDKMKMYGQRKRHKKHKISRKEWEACKEYFGGCAYCGITEEEHRFKNKQDLHKEHADDNGTNDLSNCIPACKNCNSQKWEYELEEWYNKNNINYTQERYDKIMKWLNKDHKLFIKKLCIMRIKG